MWASPGVHVLNTADREVFRVRNRSVAATAVLPGPLKVSPSFTAAKVAIKNAWIWREDGGAYEGCSGLS